MAADQNTCFADSCNHVCKPGKPYCYHHRCLWYLYDAVSTFSDSGFPDSCFEWKGKPNSDGYGQITIDRQTFKLHRLFCRCFNGPPKHYQTECRHACGNPRCINPAHLEWGTHEDNMHDMMLHGRHYNRALDNAKLSISDARMIFVDARPYTEIAKSYNIAINHVSAIKKRRKWASHTTDLVPIGTREPTEKYVVEFLEQAASCDKDECLTWMRGTSASGYPTGRFNGCDVYVHRLIAQRFIGETGGMFVLRSCGNACCCNPHHMRLKSKKPRS